MRHTIEETAELLKSINWAAKSLPGQFLKALREEKGISQKEIAERMGMAASSVSALERRNNIELKRIRQYLDCIQVDYGHAKTLYSALLNLNISLDELLNIEDPEKKVSDKTTDAENIRDEIIKWANQADIIGLSMVLKYIHMYQAYDESNEVSIEE